ncbi:MAG: hypothetical protein ACTSWQ_00505 [Candidatus Thorarchaeota archaeon]
MRQSIINKLNTHNKKSRTIRRNIEDSDEFSRVIEEWLNTKVKKDDNN